MIDQQTINRYTELLKKELIPSTGCTEPVAIALAAAKAAKLLGEPVRGLRVGCSAKIIKNVKSVRIPGLDEFVGMEAAAVAGALAGDADSCMQVLGKIDNAQKEEIARALAGDLCEAYCLDSPHELHIVIDARGDYHRATVEVRDAHDRVTLLSRDEEVLFCLADADPCMDALCESTPEQDAALSLASIKEYADTADLALIAPILEPQIECNLAIAKVGISGNYGAHYGAMLLMDDYDVYRKMEAYTAAASEARMSGCSMPVIINSGSGNQGIASSVPSIVYCLEKGYNKEKMLRMLAFANLATVYQKQFIGKLGSFCGAISAACSSGAALTYIENGSLVQIGNTVSNTLAVLTGVICDGAKASCGAKIAMGLHAAIIAHKQAMANLAYHAGDGIVCADADMTIRGVGKIAREGMRDTDAHILEVMLGKGQQTP